MIKLSLYTMTFYVNYTGLEIMLKLIFITFDSCN